ncbi:MAG: formate/nitrite transporter family protein, partial [Candidatus Thioglobus sp.]
MSYLVPTDVVEKMVISGAMKMNMPTSTTIIRAVMAGAILGLAAVFAITVAIKSGSPIVGAVLFPVGFIMLILFGYDLLTGVVVLGVPQYRLAPHHHPKTSPNPCQIVCQFVL